MDIFSLLHEEYGFAPLDAYELCSRVYRGGAFTKDTIYLRGLLRIKALLGSGQPLSQLYVGKVSFSDLPFLETLKKEHLIGEASIKPHFLEIDEPQQRLRTLANKNIEELVD